ncbi:hypothetical protein LR48_Vigan01g241100 [Vigna angularis]|uniref:DUF7887 domain-containing protein n=2 Tax=Phaseolus angularis TaxID=3914 RepID=A0A0L9TQL7_PHAAN|nr:uncharacterized protein LOC108340945 isoform X1 [Vigna angularis]KAG2408099.1 uncharacterized protein HKW66_Vig0029210 [Vigna angularis]KOM32855.1 hypothetical protein LR48_Vigan01g241100 [Vigna angularis]BAT76144.1 hypothetical protein VIGAN_01410700 [Vigna angularis var. angularis]
MVGTGIRCGVLGFNYYVPMKKIGRRSGTTLAKRKDFDENDKLQQRPFSPLKISKSNIARAAIGVFGLGFIDAGYSGDWSRIGVITSESEELLKVAAFLVVPLCIFLVFFLPTDTDS